MTSPDLPAMLRVAEAYVPGCSLVAWVEFNNTFSREACIGLLSLLLAQQAENAAKDARIAELECRLDCDAGYLRTSVADNPDVPGAVRIYAGEIAKTIAALLSSPPATGGLDG
jgi:hypothetical protein